MNNNLLQVKFTERLNKLASSDYPNLQCWMIAEAFNKAMDAWVSRQLEGINQTKSGAEGSIRSIDKLRTILIKNAPLAMINAGDYWIADLPDNYTEWSRVSADAEAQCCPPRRLKIYLGNEANLDIDLLSKEVQPSFDWAETFATVVGNSVLIYTNNCFNIVNPSLTYYRRATHIKIENCTDPDTGDIVPVGGGIECEFSNQITETIIDEGAAILAADMDDINKKQMLNQDAELSN